MELFRGMTKRKNADQMNHLLQDVGRAKTMMSTLTFDIVFKSLQIIILGVSMFLTGPGRSRRNIFAVFYSFVTPNTFHRSISKDDDDDDNDNNNNNK